MIGNPQSVALASTTLDSERHESTPVVVLHGLFGSSANWRTVGRALATRRPVYLLDARNHGGSPHTERMSYDDQSRDLEAFLDRQGLDEANIIGHSMGGKAAMRFALTTPSRVAALVIVDIAPVSYSVTTTTGGGENEHAHLIDTMLRLDPGVFTERRGIDAALSDEIADPTLRAFLMHNLLRDGKGFRWRLNLPILRASLSALRAFPLDSITPFTQPTLFIQGAKSDYISAACFPNMSALFPNYALTSISDAGHWVHAEQPESVVNAIETFFDKADREA